MISLLTNITFLRLVAVAMIFVVTAVYFLRKEPTVKSFVAFIAGDLVGISILAFSEYLKDAAALPYIVVSITMVVLFDVWLIAKAFAHNKKGNENGK